MAATEYDILRDEQERSALLRTIASVETAIAVSTPGTRRVLENAVENAKIRIVTLDKKIEDAKTEHAAEAQAQAVAIATLAAKEKALSASERETYSGFLKEAFFTKKDFGKLEQFYAHSWDRLSEGGKDEMSHRVWEGVRHGEYRFSDLPKGVRDKEEDRVYAKFVDPSRNRDSLEPIQEGDRSDFVRAYKAGDRKGAAEVLNRDSFRRNLASSNASGAEHQAVPAGKEADDRGVLADDKPRDTVSNSSSAMAKIQLASEKLKDFTLDDSPAAPAVASIPMAGAAQVSGRSPG